MVVNEDTTLGQVIKLLHENKVHRVYVCEKEKPIAIISIGDVLNYLRKTVPYPEEMPESYRSTKLEVKDKEREKQEDEKHAYVFFCCFLDDW